MGLLLKYSHLLIAVWLLYVAVLDLFSRRVVGLAMHERMTADLVLAALEQAILHRQPTAGLVHHSDKGSQYTSDDFQKLLLMYSMIASMSGTGNCYDNAAMESFSTRLKLSMFILSVIKLVIKRSKVSLNTLKFFIIVNVVTQQ